MSCTCTRSGTREYQRNLALNLNQQGNSGWEGMCSKTPTNTTIFSNHCCGVHSFPRGVFLVSGTLKHFWFCCKFDFLSESHTPLTV